MSWLLAAATFLCFINVPEKTRSMSPLWAACSGLQIVVLMECWRSLEANIMASLEGFQPVITAKLPKEAAFDLLLHRTSVGVC